MKTEEDCAYYLGSQAKQGGRSEYRNVNLTLLKVKIDMRFCILVQSFSYLFLALKYFGLFSTIQNVSFKDMLVLLLRENCNLSVFTPWVL